MGSLLAKLPFNQKARILILGLDAAGKTKILHRLRFQENVATLPTIGFGIQEFSPVKNVTFTMWDVGGQEQIRNSWKDFYKGSHGLVFVVDAADAERFQESRRALLNILNSDAMDRGVPTMILANKQDLQDALKAPELTAKMGLHDLQTNPWYVQETSALNGNGLNEAMERLITMVKRYQKKRKSI